MIQTITPEFYRDFFHAFSEKFQVRKKKHEKFFAAFKKADQERAEGLLTRKKFFTLLENSYKYIEKRYYTPMKVPTLQNNFEQLIIEQFKLSTDVKQVRYYRGGGNYLESDQEVQERVVREFFRNQMFKTIFEDEENKDNRVSLESATFYADREKFIEYLKTNASSAIAEFLSKVKISSLTFIKNVGKSGKEISVSSAFCEAVKLEKIAIETSPSLTEIVTIIAKLAKKHVLLDEEFKERVIKPMLLQAGESEQSLNDAMSDLMNQAARKNDIDFYQYVSERYNVSPTNIQNIPQLLSE